MDITTITTFVNTTQFAIGILVGFLVTEIANLLVDRFYKRKKVNINSLKELILTAHADMTSSANKINELYKIILSLEK